LLTASLQGWCEGGYLIIDDTVWARWAVQSEAVSGVWSSSHARVLRGQPGVLLVWTNGREFAYHQAIAASLQAGFYFAHAYASWERGMNENTNGLVRQYFPKKSDFSKIKDSDVQRAMERLNNRPRKSRGDKTPNQVFFKQKKIALYNLNPRDIIDLCIYNYRWPSCRDCFLTDSMGAAKKTSK
jgi:hypothetical protein